MSDQECLVPTENYPFTSGTFDFIREHAWLIKDTSKRIDVPVVAVAGSIADEFNTRSKFFWLRGAFDWLQDNAVFSWLPSSVYDAGAKYGSGSKILNPTRNDVGHANINIATARQMYQQYGALFPKRLQEWDALVQYVMTIEGTILVSALVIKKGQQELASYLRGRPLEIQEALLVTYFKQGPSFIDRYKQKVQRLAAKPGEIKPGEGCGVYHQRKRILKALGLGG